MKTKKDEEGLKLYAVRHHDGKWFKRSGSFLDSCWVDKLSKASIYSTPGPARALITTFAENISFAPIPKLVVLVAHIDQVIDETERVLAVGAKKRRATIQREINAVTRTRDEAASRINKLIEKLDE